MAEIVQLKNDNGASVYPVTMGEAINMAGGKTLDQAFNEAKSQILNDISSKKNELAAEVDEKKTEFNNLYTAKSGLLSTEFTTKTNELQTDFTAKKSALQTDFDRYSAILDVNKKAGFYDGQSRITNYPIGSIIMATLIDGGVPMEFYSGVYGKNHTSPIYDTGFPTYFETSTGGWMITNKTHELEGTWVCRGAFPSPKNVSDSRIPDPAWRILLQRIS